MKSFSDKNLPKEKIQLVNNNKGLLTIDKSSLLANKGKLSFTGELHTHIPISLTEALKGDEIRLFYMLKKMTIDGRICHSLDQKELAKMMNTSQPTISRRISVLRIKRWVTLIHNKNQNNIKGRNSLIINDRPVTIEEVLASDHQFLVFLQECSKSGQGRLKQLSKEELFNMPKELLLTHNILVADAGDVTNSSLTDENDSDSMPVINNTDTDSTVLEDTFTETEKYHQTTETVQKQQTDKTVEETPTTDKKTNSFAFFENSELLSEILWDMEHDQLYFGKSTVHAIKNCLKKKSYKSKDGKPFRWICTEDKAIEMLIVLLSDKPDSPLNYLKTLIFADSNEEFLLKPKQRQLLVNYHKRINPDYQVESRPVKANETPLEQFIRWMNTPSDKREFKPMQLCEGQKIKALTDLQQWGINAEAVTELTLPTWITDLSVRRELIARGISIDENNIDRVSNLSLHFGDEDKSLDYEAICKAIELGLLTAEVE
ncbi:MAG: hypothetical protein KGV56_04225 [Gammaproteobacteria bacterium]|nr:hypothetical protein [Gammaproteobacteria bacterium]